MSPSSLLDQDGGKTVRGEMQAGCLYYILRRHLLRGARRGAV